MISRKQKLIIIESDQLLVRTTLFLTVLRERSEEARRQQRS